MPKLALLLLVLPLAVAAQVYRWVDEAGQVQFSDRPPHADVEALELRPNVAGTHGLRPGEEAWLERLRAAPARHLRERPTAAALRASVAAQRRCARYRLELGDHRAERRRGCRASRCAALDRRIAYYEALLGAECVGLSSD